MFFFKSPEKADSVAIFQVQNHPHLFPEQDNERTPSLHVVLIPRQNKSSFAALKVLLQETKTHALTSVPSLVRFETL
jgi:hypothetical protein